MAAKRTISDSITVERNGQTHTGSRLIEGTRKLMQNISYMGHSKWDGHQYSPFEQATMDSVARLILHELIQECAARER